MSVRLSLLTKFGAHVLYTLPSISYLGHLDDTPKQNEEAKNQAIIRNERTDGGRTNNNSKSTLENIQVYTRLNMHIHT